MSDTTATPQTIVPGGQVDDPNVLRTDDFGLGGNLRDQLVTALTERWNPDDPGATTLDEDGSADTAATPAPAQQPDDSQDPPQGQPSQDGAGGGRAAEDDGTGGAATPPPATDDTPPPGTQPPAQPTDQEVFDLNAYARDYFGTDLTRDQSQRLFSMLSRLQSLTPDEQAWIDGVLSGGQAGQYPGTMGQPASGGSQQVQPTVGTAPQGQSADDPAVAVLGARPDNDEYAAQQWDLTARGIRWQAEQTAAIQADIARTTQFQMEQAQAQAAAKVDTAVQAWRTSYPVMSDGEFDGLVQRAAQTGQLPALVAHHHGDVEAATRALLEQQFWADPTLRERAIANVASGRAPGDAATVDPASPVAQQQQVADQGRQALASSVAGGGGSVTPATQTVPKDPEQRKAAMAAEIAAQHDFT